MLLASAVALVVAATVVFTLFVRKGDLPEPEPVSPAKHLEDRKAQIYENLRDLQFEYRVGKLSDADYQKTKLDLQKELAKTLAEIDSIQPAQPRPVERKKPDPPQVSDLCPHCGSKFAQPMRFCGACGKVMV